MKIYVLLLLCSANVVLSKKVDSVVFQNLILATINETAPNFEPCNGNVLRKAVFGDLIEIKRHGYFHWCVFVSNETVIQLNNPEFDRLTIENAYENFTGQVELRNLIQLAGRDHCRINNKISEAKRKHLRILSSSEILAKMIEESEHNVTYYNVVSYNCEHFAAKLKFGVPFSSQVDTYNIK